MTSRTLNVTVSYYSLHPCGCISNIPLSTSVLDCKLSLRSNSCHLLHEAFSNSSGRICHPSPCVPTAPCSQLLLSHLDVRAVQIKSRSGSAWGWTVSLIFHRHPRIQCLEDSHIFFLVNENVIESIKMKGGAHACGVKKVIILFKNSICYPSCVKVIFLIRLAVKCRLWTSFKHATLCAECSHSLLPSNP